MDRLRDLCPCLAADFAAVQATSPDRRAETASLTSNAETPTDLSDVEPSEAAPSYASWAASLVLDAGRQIASHVRPDDKLSPHWELLEKGAEMKRHGEGGATAVTLTLSSDRSMLTWRAPHADSGVVALSSISAVGDPPPGWFSAPAAGEFVVSADGIELRLEAATVETKSAWIEALRAVSERAASDREGRKLGHEARQQLNLEMRRREAERRKAEAMKGISGGMKHTARAMLAR